MTICPSRRSRARKCSENTVKSRLNYARKTLRAELEQDEKQSGIRFYTITLLSLRSAVAWLIEHTAPVERSIIAVGSNLSQLAATAPTLGAGVQAATAASTVAQMGAAAGTLTPVALFITTYRRQIIAGLLALLGIGTVVGTVTLLQDPQPEPTAIIRFCSGNA